MPRIDDYSQKSRNEIIKLLEDHAVSWEDDTSKTLPVVRFTTPTGKAGVIAYGSGGDPKAYLQARKQAKHALLRAGVELRSKEGEPEDTKETPPESFPEVPRYTDQGYVVFQQHQYQYDVPGSEPSDFIVVKVTEELLATKGDVLIIPLHQPDRIVHLAEDDYRLYFRPKRKIEEPVTPAVDFAPLMTKLQELQDSVQRLHPTKNVPLRVRKVEPPTVSDRVPVSYEQPGLAAEEPGLPEDFEEDYPAEPVRPEQPDIPDQPEPEPEREPETESGTRFPPPTQDHRQFSRVAGVTPQMGRVLLAMYFLHGNGQEEFPSRPVQDLLSEVDKRQVSGNLSSAMAKGFVERKMTDQGYIYRLTEKGAEAARTLGTLPWDQRDLPYPQWMELFEMMH